MINKITRNQLSDMFQSIADIMADKEEELCKRDAQLGDGDLGLTMKKGFGALPKIVQGLESPELSKTIMKAAMLMSSLIPSTMGFLMSSGLMEAGKSLSEKSFIDADGLVQFLVGYWNGIVKRGKCSVGERTVLDSMDAAAKAAQEELKKNPDSSLLQIAIAAEKGAKAGVERTKFMVPKYGKAAVHKEACKGIEDQGAVAGLYVVSAIRNYIETT